MQILVTGGTGFIGNELLPVLVEGGHDLIVLSRQSLPDKAGVSYVSELAQVSADTRVDAVINLAGASLAGKRWSPAYKAEIVDSRLAMTEALISWIESRQQRPAVMLSASAIGYYGHHADESLDEQAAQTPGFAQNLCDRWELVASRARELGVRTCLMRLGVVLDSGGGAFQQMAPPFKFGLGNWIGSGNQWLSWIHRKDVIAAILLLLTADSMNGAYNLTAPEPVTSRGFSQAMGKIRRQWISVPMPAAVMRLMLGEMADELLVNGQRVVPARLQAAGFQFKYPEIDRALAEIMNA